MKIGYYTIISLLILSLATQNVFAEDQYTVEVIPGNWKDVDFEDVFFTSEQAWAVGESGVITHTYDGLDWHEQTSGVVTDLNAIYFNEGTREGWIVGNHGVILHTTDGGNLWEIQRSDTLLNLYDVHFLTRELGWAVGELGVIIYTDDGGLTWTKQDVDPASLHEDLHGVHIHSKILGWAVGNKGTILAWNGGVWRKQRTITTHDLYGLHFVSLSTGWAVGEGGIILRCSSVYDWSVLGRMTSSNLNAVHFSADTKKYGWIVGDQGTILYTDSYGTNINYWKVQSFQSSTGLNAVYAITPSHIWVLGDNGTILRLVGRSIGLTKITPISPSGYISETTPTFKWDSSNEDIESIQYTLFIDNDDTPYDGVSIPTGTALSHTLSPGDPISSLLEGKYSWGVRTSGLDSVESDRTIFTVDLSAPTGTVKINGGDQFTNSILVTLGLSASDLLSTGGPGSGVATMQFSNDGLTWSAPEPYAEEKIWDLSKYGGNSQNGLKTVYARFIDQLGHEITTPARDDIILDTEPPTGSIVINGGAEFTGPDKVILSLSASDERSGVEDGNVILSNNGKDWSQLLPYRTTISWGFNIYGGDGEEGTKTVYAKFMDAVGNWMPVPATDTIVLDKTGPTGSIVINGGEEFTNSSMVKLTLSSYDQTGVVSMQFSNDGKNWSPLEPCRTVRDNWDLSQYGGNANDGRKTVFVRFVDGVGNVTDPAISARITFKSRVFAEVQIYAPKIPGKIKRNDIVRVDGKADTGGALLSVKVLDEGDRLVNIDLTDVVYDPNTGVISGSFNVGNLNAQAIRLKVTVEDHLHNQAEAFSGILTVDNDPPGNVSARIDQGNITNSTSVKLIMTATDAVDMNLYGDVVDQGAWIKFSELLWIKLTEGNGAKEVRVKFRDDVGNESAEVATQILLDTIMPVGTIVINDNAETSKSFVVKLTLSASDENGIASYSLRNDDGSWSPALNFYPSALTSGPHVLQVDEWDLRSYDGNETDGLRSVSVKYKDSAGNWSEIFSDDIQVSATVPTISVQLVKDKQEATKPVTVTAIIKPGRNPITEAILYYRIKGTSEYTAVSMTKLPGIYYSAEIPGSVVTFAGLEYYVSASDGLWPVTHPPENAPIAPNSFTVVDTIPPVIEHSPVAKVPVKSSPKITARVTDAVGLKQVSLFYKFSEDKSYKKLDMVLETSPDVYSAAIPALNWPGSVNYYIEAVDSSSNSATNPVRGSSQPYSVSFMDIDSPIISHTVIPDNQEAGNPVLIGASVTDNVGLKEVLLKYRVTGKEEFVEVEMSSVGSYYSVEIPGNIVMPGIIEYAITASDGSPESDDAKVSRSFTVVDTTPPDIEISFVPSQAEVYKEISVEAKVTDKVKVKEVKLYYKGVLDTNFNVLNMPGLGSKYSVKIPAQERAGQVKFYVYAEDSQGVSATEPDVDPQNIPRVIDIIDTSKPLIQHLPVLDVHEAGIPVNITASVTDDVRVADVSLHYRTAGQNSFKLKQMVETVGGAYECTIPGPDVISPGIEYYIKAMDDSVNVTTHPAANPDKLPHLFSVVDTVPPEIVYDPSSLETVLITDPIVVTAVVTDLIGIKEAKIFYRREEEKDFSSRLFESAGDDEYSAAIPNPSSETTIYYYIQAEDNSGNKTTSPEIYSISIDDPFPPLPPTGLSASSLPGGRIVLTWKLSTSPDTYEYNIYTDNGSGNVDFSVIYDSVDKSTRNWESPVLGEGTYKFVVRAVDGSGNEEANASSVSARADAVAPNAVTDLAATSLPGGRIQLKWKLSSSSDAATYNIYWDNAQVNIDYSSALARVDDPVTLYESGQLKEGTIYRFVVRCQDDAGNEEKNTGFVSARADASPPANVTGLSSSTHKLGEWANQTRITVRWNPAVDTGTGLSGYSLIWDTSERTIPDKSIDLGNEVTYTAELSGGIARGQYFHIRPVDNAGNWSDEAAHLGPFLIDTVSPEPPANLKASSQPGGKVKLDWKGSASADVLKYNIYWDNGTGTISYSSPVSVVAEPTWTSAALDDGKTYQFSVRAEDQAGNEEKNTDKSSTIADSQSPSIVHEPITWLLEQEITDVSIMVIVDDASGLDTVELHYRTRGTVTYTNMPMTRGTGNIYRSQIPSSAFTSAGLDYYISAIDEAGNIATYPVQTIVVSNSLQIPIDASRENEITVGAGSSVFISTGTFDNDTQIRVTVPRYVPEPQTGLSKHIVTREFELDVEPNKSIRITLRYSDDKVAGEDEDKLAMYQWDGLRWKYLAKVIPQENSAVVMTREMGIFSIIGDYEPPLISDLQPSGYAMPDAMITTRVEDNGSGIDPKSLDIKINGKSIRIPDTALKDTELSFTPTEKLEHGYYSLQITARDNAGNQTVASSEFLVTSGLALEDVFCYPNPFQPSRGTRFAYMLTESVNSLTIRIYSMDGKLVRKIDGEPSIGKNQVFWDCKDEEGEFVLNTVYICHIEAEGAGDTVVKTIKIAAWE